MYLEFILWLMISYDKMKQWQNGRNNIVKNAKINKLKQWERLKWKKMKETIIPSFVQVALKETKTSLENSSLKKRNN